MNITMIDHDVKEPECRVVGEAVTSIFWRKFYNQPYSKDK